MTISRCTRPRSVWLAFIIVGLVFGSSVVAEAQPRPIPGDTRPITISRGGRHFRSTTIAQERAPNGQPMRAGSLLVRFRSGTAETARAAAHQAVGGQVIRALRAANTVRVNVAPGATPSALAGYRARPDVLWAEPDYIFHPAYTPNDPLLDQQWNLTRISAQTAWDRSRSSPAIPIAILDCGVFSNSSSYTAPDGRPGHPDLRDKVQVERNFTTAPDADDLCNHGTHVAGVAAANTDDGIGIAGVGFDATIINGKVLGDDGLGTADWLSEGIMWAADSGARVINASVVGSDPCPAIVQSAIDYAWAHGALVVAAAGNEGTVGADAPGNCDNVLTVAASGLSDERASFSNYGDRVSIAAPGVLIRSTDNLGDYSSFHGTSQAAAHVSGEAALLWTTEFGTSNQTVGTRICSTADQVSGTGSLWSCGRANAAAAVEQAGSGTEALTPLLECVEAPSGTRPGVRPVVRPGRAPVAPAPRVSPPTSTTRPTPSRVQPARTAAATTSYVAHFGYQNDAARIVVVPVGSANQFSPPPADQGQPNIFEPGVHRDLFNVPFDGQPLTWFLGPRSDTASSDPALACATIAVDATIANFTFLPDPIQVPIGGTVRWMNQDATGHTVTAVDQSWTSPVLAQDQSFTRTFDQPGQFDYFCEPHPQMRGSIIVQ